MKTFEHIDAASLEDAIRALGESPRAQPLAGGTDLLTRMKLGITAPSRLVNLKTVKHMDSISFDEQSGLMLGALATLSDIAAATVVRQHYAVLVRAIQVSASPQLRNAATIGGNLLQYSRCWYYRGEFNCWLKGGETCYARDGENGPHAIFGSGPCYTVHPSDPATALSALGAQVVIQGSQGIRREPVAGFFQAPRARSRQLTILARDEIVAGVHVPAPHEGSRGTYVKAMPRRVWSFALARVAAQLVFNGSSVSEARIVLGGVAPTPWPVPDAAAAIIGGRLTKAAILEAAERSVAGAQPLAKNVYKVGLVKGLVTKALTELQRPVRAS